MANTYTWKVSKLECYPQKDSRDNVVFNVHCQVFGSDGQLEVSRFCSQKVEYVPQAPFTEFAKLSESQVVQWAKDAMGEQQVAQIESWLDSKLDEINNPKVISPSLPWAA